MSEFTFNRNLIQRFWTERSLKGRTRWTDSRILDFEVATISSLTNCGRPKSILDLGCGFGELSLSLLGSDDFLVAVDMGSGFATGFGSNQKANFVHSNVTEFVPNTKFNLIVLFGVVAYLNQTDEDDIYKKLSKWLHRDGIAIIKHQCGVTEEIIIDGWSAELETNYQARYPHVASQLAGLKRYFEVVEVISYPEFANKFMTLDISCLSVECNCKLSGKVGAYVSLDVMPDSKSL